MIHRLFRSQPRDRRQDTESICGEEDDVRRRRTEVLLAGVRDELDRIGAAGVFRLAGIGEVELAGILVHGHVLEDRAEHLGGRVDLGLALGREVDHLRIAAAFEVEDRRVRPAMLVVTDQSAAGVGRKRGLAGAGKPEEDRAGAVRTDVGRTVHRHHALSREQVVQQAEHALLHLARIFGVADQDQLLGEVDRDHGVAAAAMAVRVRLEARQVDDGVFGRKACQFIGSRANQQSADEQIVPCHLGDDANVDAVFRLAAAEQVSDIELFLAFQRFEEISLEVGPVINRHRLVDLAPVDRIFSGGIANDKLVLHTAAGELAGIDQQSPVLGQPSLALLQRVFDQR